ncbi:hypothetical protein C7293_20970 [filamentous cyanobacterium CCT1]|nr:hypothetical protein C7293_20970 [filamentous cyanobacterium CCT1]PSN76519.1 hypothetical protein C8B47_26905 [filamentous cyanobacterium CCP4]
MGASILSFPVVLDPICCPSCHTTDGVKHGKNAEGKQRYRCRPGGLPRPPQPGPPDTTFSSLRERSSNAK